MKHLKFLKYIVLPLFIILLLGVGKLKVNEHHTSVVETIDWDNSWCLPSIEGQPNPGVAGAYAGFAGNLMVVAGGANFPDAMPWDGGTKTWHSTIYLLNTTHVDNAWTISQTTLPASLGYGVSIQLPDGILCIGGCTPYTVTNSVFMITQRDGDVVIDTNYPSLPQPLTNHSASFADNKVFVAGGFTDNTQQDAKGCFYQLDLNNLAQGWVELATWPGAPRAYAVSAAQSNGDALCYYLFGGRNTLSSGETEVYTDGFVYNTQLNTWSKLQGDYPLMAGTAVATGDNQLLLLGGVPELLPAGNQHPGFDNTIRSFNTRTNELNELSTSPFPIAVTTTAFVNNNTLYIASGELKPGIRTPSILRGELVYNSSAVR